jgi:hypothetical protein
MAMDVKAFTGVVTVMMIAFLMSLMPEGKMNCGSFPTSFWREDGKSTRQREESPARQ